MRALGYMRVMYPVVKGHMGYVRVAGHDHPEAVPHQDDINTGGIDQILQVPVFQSSCLVYSMQYTNMPSLTSEQTVA